MRLKGHKGALKIAGKTAASLGAWYCERDPGTKRVEVVAHALSVDSFLIKRKPLKLVLDLQRHKERNVRGYRLEGQTIHVEIDWT